MEQFATLFSELDQTNKTNEKVALLKSYFEQASNEDCLWTIALFSHKRPGRAVNTTLLKTWAMKYAGIPGWLFEESYHTVGDLAETFSLLLPSPTSTSSKTLTEWIEFLVSLKRVEEENEKKRLVLAAWDELNRQERLVFTKIMTGGFRIGISQNLMVRALSEVLQMESATVTHKIMGNWDPQSITFEELLLTDTDDADLSKPYPFYLAHPLESEVSELGKIDEWQAEWKWDGIRSQLIIRKDELFIWSRGEELVTEKFPELHVLKEMLPNGTVVDGELLTYKNDQVLPFNVLQTRIGRKNVSKKTIQTAPVAIRAYDLLEFEGADIRDESLSTRRKHLESIISSLPEEAPLHLSETVTFRSWGELAQERERAREVLSEGLMLKRLNSTYQVGRKRGDWWKWKIAPLTTDAVMIYAQKGHGRRADLYTDYTFAVWDGDQLVPFAKAYSGLTDSEIREVDRFVKQHTLERFGPVRTVIPALVFEIAFEGIHKSSRHKSGIAVRFPRIHRWRQDKPKEEANTLEDLKKLLQSSEV